MNKMLRNKKGLLKLVIILAVIIMFLSVTPGEGAKLNVHVSNWDRKSRFEKIYEVTKITLSCNICKLVLK